jgi:molybdate transport system substrate-binding protein
VQPNPLLYLLLAIPALLAYPTMASAQLKVMISGGFSTAYRQALPDFEKASGLKVTTLSGSSQGKGPETIAAQLARGVPVDVVIMSREGLGELMKEGRIAAGTDADLATAAIGVAVRAGAKKPDVSTIAGFRQALVSATLVAVPASTSGIFLTQEVFPKLGVADKIKVRVMARGSQSADLVVKGEADLVVQPVSELIHVQGLSYAGEIPMEVQLIQMFAAAVVTGSKEADAGKKLIAYLASSQVAPAIKQNGMEPARK